MHQGYGYPDGMVWGWGLLGTLLPLLPWAGLILGVALLARNGRPRLGTDRPAPLSQQVVPDDRALTILRERYARGEIDTSEYEERRRSLLGEQPSL
jgi:putative membrane protein